MLLDLFSAQSQEPFNDRGIAIGPILFIIAVLGVLAAAIAASSGSFSTSTTSTSGDIKASALIEVGQNLKIGFERISASVPYADIGMTGTTASTDLFSPSGGGITKPSPSIDIGTPWYYWDVTSSELKIGSGISPNKMAFYHVRYETCKSLNKKLRNTTTIPAVIPMSGRIEDVSPDAWTNELQGQLAGCFLEMIWDPHDPPLEGDYWFYQVLGIQ